MNTCVFCKIIAGNLPSASIYKDQETFAFLDIHPINPGHTLVVTKKHVADIEKATNENLAAITRTIKYIAPSVLSSVGSDSYNIIVNNRKTAGQVFDHLHFHIIPRFANDGYSPWKGQPYASGERKRLCQKIKAALKTPST